MAIFPHSGLSSTRDDLPADDVFSSQVESGPAEFSRAPKTEETGVGFLGLSGKLFFGSKFKIKTCFQLPNTFGALPDPTQCRVCHFDVIPKRFAC